MTRRACSDDEAHQAVDVAQRHGTTAAAEWLGVATFTMRAIRHELDPTYTRGRGHPTREEAARAKPSRLCPCPRCRGHYRTLSIKAEQRYTQRRSIAPSDKPDWMDQGNCRGMDPDIWFPDRGESTARQKQICASCTVRDECLEVALEHAIRFGIWGGKSERERRRLRRARNAERREQAS